LLGEDAGGLVRAICKKATGVTPSEARASLKRAKIMIDFPVPNITEQPPAHPPPPEEQKPEVPVAIKSAGKREAGTLAAMSEATLQDLIDAGLIKSPLELEREYKGARLVATILPDGRVSFGGQSYGSLSTAAGMARKSIVGAPKGKPFPATNGWAFWQFRDPTTGELLQVDTIRRTKR
jgi:hypothetical protein